MIENPETYLDVVHGQVALVCEDTYCRKQMTHSQGWIPDIWYEILPDKCLPEEAVRIRAQHVASHPAVTE